MSALNVFNLLDYSMHSILEHNLIFDACIQPKVHSCTKRQQLSSHFGQKDPCRHHDARDEASAHKHTLTPQHYFHYFCLLNLYLFQLVAITGC